MMNHRKIIIATCLFAAFLLFIPFPLGAEMLTGMVVAMDEQKRQIILQPVSSDKKDENTFFSPSQVVVEKSSTFQQHWRGNRIFPGCVRINGIIRVWGEFSEDTKIFLATDIRGPGNGHDPTGVRTRLRRGRRFFYSEETNSALFPRHGFRQ